MRSAHLLPLVLLLACTERVSDDLTDTDVGTETDTDSETETDTETETQTEAPPECESRDIPAQPIEESIDCRPEPHSKVEVPRRIWSTMIDASGAYLRVAQTNDDNEDGVIDDLDASDIVGTADAIMALEGNGNIRFSRGPGLGGSIAIGHLNNFRPTTIVRKIPYHTPSTVDPATGTTLRAAVRLRELDSRPSFISLANLDGDNTIEVVAGASVFSWDGDLVALGSADEGYEGHLSAATSDLDGDGILEIVTGDSIYTNKLNVWCAIAPWHYLSTASPGDLHLQSGLELFVYNPTRMGIVDSNCDWVVQREFFYPAPTPGEYAGVGKAIIAPLTSPTPPFQSVARGGWWTDDGTYQAGIAALDQDLQTLWKFPDGGQPFITADLDGDGLFEVLTIMQGSGSHDLVALNGRTGEVLWRLDDRNYQDVVVADVDKDGQAEIIASSYRDFDPDNPNDTGARITMFKGEGTGWAPAQTWWHQHHFTPYAASPDGSIRPAPGIDKHPHYGTYRAAFDPGVLYGHGSEPRVRVVDVCEDECEAGVAWAWIQVGNAGVLDLDLPLVVDLTATVDGETQVVASVNIEGTLKAGTWRAGRGVRIDDLSAPLTDLKATLRGEGWRADPCEAQGLRFEWADAVCGG